MLHQTSIQIVSCRVNLPFFPSKKMKCHTVSIYSISLPAELSSVVPPTLLGKGFSYSQPVCLQFTSLVPCNPSSIYLTRPNLRSLFSCVSKCTELLRTKKNVQAFLYSSHTLLLQGLDWTSLGLHFWICSTFARRSNFECLF